MATVPVENIFYLLSYAWNLLDEMEDVRVEAEQLPSSADLLARLLITGTSRLLRRGIDQGYLPKTEVLNTIRGRVDFSASYRRLLFHQARVQCDFEEFLPDVLHNRILRSVLASLASCKDLASAQRSDLGSLLRRMEGITPLRITHAHFHQVRLHRNNAHYRLLMNLCELVWENVLVNEQSGEVTFRDFMRDPHQMARLFESFVANFYKKHSGWRVSAQERIRWDTPTPHELLPEMRADVVLRSEERVLLVECKFYGETLQEGPWGGVPKLHSSHLYQVSTYLQHMAATSPDQGLVGLLLYPTVGVGLRENLILSGKQIRVRTIDLSRSWSEVEAQMANNLPDAFNVDFKFEPISNNLNG